MFPSNSKIQAVLTKNKALFRLFQKNILKSMNVSSFSRNKPIIWEIVGALFGKVFDMTRLYILLIFDIKKIPDLFEIPSHI